MQVMATDHCPFFFDGTKSIDYEGEKITIPGKELGANDFTKIPNGLPGVGDRMLVMWTKGVGEGRITPNRFVEMMCTNPAKIFGLYPKKGTIMPGSEADLSIWDPNKEIIYGVKYSNHRTDYNLYEGWKLRGIIEKVFLRGKLIVTISPGTESGNGLLSGTYRIFKSDANNFPLPIFSFYRFFLKKGEVSKPHIYGWCSNPMFYLVLLILVIPQKAFPPSSSTTGLVLQ